MSKLGLLVAGATGYVLGARAGRERYDQIAALAQRVWTHPKVQQASHQAQDYAREKAPEVGERLGEVAKAAAVKATEAVTSSTGDTDGSAGSDAAAVTGSGAKKAAPTKKATSTKATKQT
jgi:hypothetical protein